MSGTVCPFCKHIMTATSVKRLECRSDGGKVVELECQVCGAKMRETLEIIEGSTKKFTPNTSVVSESMEKRLFGKKEVK